MARIMIAALFLAAGLMLGPQPGLAVQPNEKLDDPVLEERAREISKGLRCLVCQNESIDDSNADLARDLRLLVRERLTAGDTNEETVQYVVDRYGEFVLLEPVFDAKNAVLWFGGPLFLLIGAIAAARVLTKQNRRVATGAGTAALTEEEQRKLDALLKE